MPLFLWDTTITKTPQWTSSAGHHRASWRASCSPCISLTCRLKFLFTFPQCPLSAASVHVHTRISLTWNRNLGYGNSKISISISLIWNISTSIFLDLDYLHFTDFSCFGFFVCFRISYLNKTRNSHLQSSEKSQLVTEIPTRIRALQHMLKVSKMWTCHF